MSAQWMQCNFIQTKPVWADSVCSISKDGIVGRRRTAQQELDARRERDDQEVMAILQAVMPMIAAGTEQQQTITLGEGDDLKYH